MSHHDTITADLTAEELRSILADSFCAGALIAADSPTVREAAAEARTFEEAFSVEDDPILRTMADYRILDLITGFPGGGGAEIEDLLQNCVEAAWVLGARHPSTYPGPHGSLIHRTEVEREVWVERLFSQLCATLRGNGWVIPGSEHPRSLEHLKNRPRTIYHRWSGDRAELRTSWILPTGSERAYQWCVRREGARIQILHRLRGDHSFRREFPVELHDVRILRDLLTRIVLHPGGTD